MASVNWCIASQPRNLAASGMVHTRIPSPEKLVFGESRVILPPASITEPMEITYIVSIVHVSISDVPSLYNVGGS